MYSWEDYKRIAVEHFIPHFGMWSELREYGPKIMVKGEGMKLWDIHGKEYIDGMSILWVVNAGHGRQEIVNAMYEQARQLGYLSLFGGYAHKPALELAERLASMLPDPLNHVFFAGSGSEAIETAVKLVKQYFHVTGEPKRYKVIARWESYHGVTYGALSVAGIRQNRNFFEPLVPGFLHFNPPYCFRCPYSLSRETCDMQCVSELENLILAEGPKTVAAVVIEPVMSAIGSLVPPENYLKRVREICDRYGIVLIFDEVNNAFGRTGKMFAFQHWNVVPDIIVFGKAITSGYAPLSAVVVSSKLFEPFKKWMFMHGLTYGGHPVSCAAALANIDIIERERLPENAAKVGEYLGKRLQEVLEFDIVGDVRGIGLHWTVQYVADKTTRKPLPSKFWVAARVESEMLKRGIYLARASVDKTYIAPPLIAQPEHIDRIIDALKDSIETVQREFKAEYATVN